MKKFVLSALFLLGVLGVGFAQQKHALVIGNGGYTHITPIEI
jgi:hypothetical protein